MEYGLDERHACLYEARSDLPPISSQQNDLRDGVPIQRKLRAAAFP